MKNIYILALAIGAFSLSVNAQIELTDDFESYNLGDISSQSPNWRTWSGLEGGAEDADVVDDFSLSGDQSMLIGDNVITDQLLLIPSAPMSGVYTVQFYAYIPAGKSGYFNMQAALTPAGSAWNQALMGGNVFFNCGGGTPGVGSIDQSPAGQECTVSAVNFGYPEDQWFKVTNVYDLNAQTWSMSIDDNPTDILNWPFAFNTQVFIELAAIDFYSAGNTNEFYIDNVTVASGLIGTEDFAANKFSVYPNPVKDMLNIKSTSSVDNVTVYDLLGKVVLQENPGKISPAINMSNLASGSYLVKVTIGNTSNTVKVLK